MIDEIELDKLQKKGKWSGWDRTHGTDLVLRLIKEIRELKEQVYTLQASMFMKALDEKMDEHECVIVEIPMLKDLMLHSKSKTVNDYVDEVALKANWKAVISEKDGNVMFYKKRNEIDGKR